VLRRDGGASALVRNEPAAGLWHFDGAAWQADPQGLAGLEADGPVLTSAGGRDRGVRLRDLDGDCICELVVGNPQQQAVFAWSPEQHRWSRLGWSLPKNTAIADGQGRDAGLRFVDVNRDGRCDVVFSDAARWSVDLFASPQTGWSRRVRAGTRSGDPKDLPMIVRADGTNNGVWFSYGHMWVQNEETGKRLPHEIDVRSFAEDLLAAP